MNAFQQYVKKLEANPNIPPDIAQLFKLGFLNIEPTREQGKVRHDFIKEDYIIL